MSINIELDVEHFITYILCLFGHDPQHDIYVGHSTGKPRAETFFNDVGGKVDTAPGQGGIPLRAGGHLKGGARDSTDGIVTGYSEGGMIAQIKTALRFGKGILAEYSNYIFMNITGRSGTDQCITTKSSIVFFDWKQLIKTDCSSPGRIVINNEIISPYKLQRINIRAGLSSPGESTFAYLITDEDSAYFNNLIAIKVVDGQQDGQINVQLILTSVEQGLAIDGEGTITSFGQNMEQLYNVYGECVRTEINNQIEAIALAVINLYDTQILAPLGDRLEDTPQYSFENFVTLAAEAPGINTITAANPTGQGRINEAWQGIANTAFYTLAVRSSILSQAILAREGGLLEELFSNASYLDSRPEWFPPRQVEGQAPIPFSHTLIQEYTIMITGFIQFIPAWNPGANAFPEQLMIPNIYTAGPTSHYYAIPILYQNYTHAGGKNEYDFLDILSRSIANILNSISDPKQKEQIRQLINSYKEVVKAKSEQFRAAQLDPGNIAETNPLVQSLYLAFSSEMAEISFEEVQIHAQQNEAKEFAELDQEVTIAEQSIQATGAALEAEIRQAAADAGVPGGGGEIKMNGGGQLDEIQGLRLYSKGTCNGIIQNLNLIAQPASQQNLYGAAGQRASRALTALTSKTDLPQIMYDGGPGFKHVLGTSNGISAAISENKIFGVSPTYNSSNIKASDIPEKRCLARPEVDAVRDISEKLGNIISAVDSATETGTPVDAASFTALIKGECDKMEQDIFQRDAEIELPIKNCGSFQNPKERRRYQKLRMFLDRFRSAFQLTALFAYFCSQRPDPLIIFKGDQPDTIYSWVTNLNNYFIEALEVFGMISDKTGKRQMINGAGRANNGFVVGSCTAIALYMGNILKDSLPGNKVRTSFAVEEGMLARQVRKATSGAGSQPDYIMLRNGVGAPDDTKLLISIMDSLIFSKKHPDATLVKKWPANRNKPVTGKLLNDLAVTERLTGPTMQAFSAALEAGQRFYVNNAVAIPIGLEIDKKQFCPMSSIIDAQTTVCRNFGIAERDGFEYGIQDFTVFCADPQNPANRLASYRVRVVPELKTNGKPPDKVWVCAYMQIGRGANTKVLINVAVSDAITGAYATTWPGGYNSGHVVSLRSDDTPLSARKTLYDLQSYISNMPVEAGVTDTYTNLIDFLMDNDGPHADMQRRNILERSSRKSLGDYLQEASAAIVNGGLLPGTRNTYTKGGVKILPPEGGRVGLHNDRPAAARGILLTLYGKSGINPRSMNGIIVSDKSGEINYAVAGRGLKPGTPMGGKNNNKKRTRRNVKKKKKTRKAKSKRAKTRKARKPKKKTRGKRNKKKRTK
tara:strand:- start:452 stop:4420 length:3969 start_codon:yes stop_codon:yes gene_type:complete